MPGFDGTGPWKNSFGRGRGRCFVGERLSGGNENRAKFLKNYLEDLERAKKAAQEELDFWENRNNGPSV